MASPSSDAITLVDYLDSLIDQLRQLLPQAVGESDVQAIHQSRVATRRLKAAIDLLEPVTGKEHRRPLARTLRRLRRRLGPLRDLDVMTGHLRELPRSAHAEAIDWLLARMQSSRAEAADAARREIAPARALARLGTWWGLREEIRQSSEATASLLSGSVHAQLDDFAAGADRLIAPRPADGRSDRDAGGKPLARPADPHAIRIAGKGLRYTLEMAQVAGHPLPADVLKTFKKMQEALGLWHDYVVLTEQALAMASREMLAHHDAEMMRKVLAVAQLPLKRSDAMLKKFAALWARQGRPLQETIRSVFPLTRDADPPEEPVTGSLVEAEEAGRKREPAADERG